MYTIKAWFGGHFRWTLAIAFSVLFMSIVIVTNLFLPNIASLIITTIFYISFVFVLIKTD